MRHSSAYARSFTCHPPTRPVSGSGASLWEFWLPSRQHAQTATTYQPLLAIGL